MDRSSAVGQLPIAHAVAVRLRDDAFDDHVIAVAVGIDEREVPMLLQIAEKKLRNLMISEDDGPSTAGSGDRPRSSDRSPG